MQLSVVFDSKLAQEGVMGRWMPETRTIKLSPALIGRDSSLLETFYHELMHSNILDGLAVGNYSIITDFWKYTLLQPNSVITELVMRSHETGRRFLHSGESFKYRATGGSIDWSEVFSDVSNWLGQPTHTRTFYSTWGFIEEVIATEFGFFMSGQPTILKSSEEFFANYIVTGSEQICFT